MSIVIKISDETGKELEKLRTHHRETWDDLVRKALEKKSKGSKKWKEEE